MDISVIDIAEELDSLTLPEVPSLSQTVIEEKINSTPAEELENLTDDEFKELTKEAARVDAALAALLERKEQLKDTARRLPYGTNERSGTTAKVSIGHNPVFNREKFEGMHPFDYYEISKEVQADENGNDQIIKRLVYPNRHLYKIEPDRPEIKRVLGKEDSDKFYDEGKKKVTFK